MKQKRMFGLTLFLVCLGILPLSAQQNVLAAGGDASGSGGTVSYSIGQIDYITATGSGGSATQGVQQPFEIYILGTNSFPSITLDATVYPNPTRSYVNLTIGSNFTEGISIRLTDTFGRDVLHQEILTETTMVKMDHLASATYFLNVSKENSLLKTFKIIKN